MRTIKELLQVMLNNPDTFRMSLCIWSSDLWINHDLYTTEEFNCIVNYIQNNRPHKFSSILVFKYRKRNFFWKPGDIKPRIEWLKKHIKKNS